MNANLEKLRSAMTKAKVDAYVIFNTDPNADEYIPEEFMVVKHLTGFTGDNAIAIVTQDFAGVWTDSRFYISGELEMRNSDFKLMKKNTNNDPSYMKFLCEKLQRGNVVAFDGNLISGADYENLCKVLKPKGIIVRNNLDLTVSFWQDRPKSKFSEIFVLEEKYSGQTVKDKFSNLSKQLEKEGANHLVITALDEIAWLLNLRAADIDFCPVIRSFMIFGAFQNECSSILFIHKNRVSNNIKSYLKELNVSLLEYDDIYKTLSQLPDGDTVMMDTVNANSRIISSVNPKAKIIDKRSPINEAKAIKNKTELDNIRKALVIDGVAMERFLYKLEKLQSTGFEGVTELSLAKLLLEQRKKGETFISESFECISAFNEHAAMPHYAPNPSSDIAIKPDGVYLVDSGGQYLLGTTDITRTVATGNFSQQFAIDYTLVLMGNLELAMAVFPEGTSGSRIEPLARMHLWRYGKNFGHGTGHGVGYCLNCHEGPQAISPVHNKVALKEGMIITDEPGIYIENKYGIRTENMLEVVKSEFSGFLKFDVVTLCHIDTRPVIKDMMTTAQIEFLNAYHRRVFDTLSPYLGADELEYLREKTKAI